MQRITRYFGFLVKGVIALVFMVEGDTSEAQTVIYIGRCNQCNNILHRDARGLLDGWILPWGCTCHPSAPYITQLSGRGVREGPHVAPLPVLAAPGACPRTFSPICQAATV